jgi:hypothetical protein
LFGQPQWTGCWELRSPATALSIGRGAYRVGECLLIGYLQRPMQDIQSGKERGVMIVKQYTVTLPGDYDMQIIRKRVVSKGPAFDDFPGLGVKVFLIRQKNHFGAESNQYAPLYLWPSVDPQTGTVSNQNVNDTYHKAGHKSISQYHSDPPASPSKVR